MQIVSAYHGLAGAASGDIGELYLPDVALRWSVTGRETAYSGGRNSLLIQPTALLDIIGSSARAL
jgi:hypothetical protein